MMKTKAPLSLLSVFGPALFLLCLFLGCNAEINHDDEAYSAIKVVSVIPKELQEPEYADSKAASRGANDFAFRLGAALAEQTGPKNLVCSPLSVWLPLAALVNA
ncbi:MAG: serpin family protein, partial [Treponema sp.]|nr:serpin family protein [Treponema sp.]